MRRIAAMLLLCSALPIGAQPPWLLFEPSTDYQVSLAAPGKGDSSNPAAYLITPPGRRDSKSLQVTIEGLTRDRRKICNSVELRKELKLTGATKAAVTVRAIVNEKLERLELDLIGLEIES